MTVYDKDGKPVKCSDVDGKILIKSGRFTAGDKKPADKLKAK